MALDKAFLNASGNITTPKGRLLWSSLFTPRKAKGGKVGKHECNILFPKESDIKVMRDSVLESGKEKFPKVFKDAAGKWPSSIKAPFKKTAENDKLVAALEAADIKVEDFPFFVAARSLDAPGVVGPNGKAESIGPEDVYAGRWARMTVDAFGYDSEGNKGVSFGLKNVQLLENDDELVVGGTRVSAETEFEAVEGVSGDDSKSTDDMWK